MQIQDLENNQRKAINNRKKDNRDYFQMVNQTQ